MIPLIGQGILIRKGFPESYDMEALINFLDQLKNGQDADISVYSLMKSTIVPEQSNEKKPLIFCKLLKELMFSKTLKCRLYITDFFDFSIYKLTHL